MQEPQCFNLLNVLHKNLKLAQKKTYLQRTIYIAKCARDFSLGPQEGRVFNILLESNIRLVNEEFNEIVITGFGLFYDGYIINMVEGPEEGILKHIETLVETLEQKASNTPDIEKMKVLVTVHNMNTRYFSQWHGRLATPPVLLDKIEPSTSVEVNNRHIKNTITKLYKMYEFLRSKPPHLLKAAMDNISELCQSNLPEVMLLEFLLDSQALQDLQEYTENYGMARVPEFTVYDEVVWPLPQDYVPYHILTDDGCKTLMESKLVEKTEENIKEAEDKVKQRTIASENKKGTEEQTEQTEQTEETEETGETEETKGSQIGEILERM